MQYNFTDISIQEDAKGNKYVQTKAVKAGDPGDRGFGLPFFNPEIISQVQKCIAQNNPAAFTFDAEIEEETINLGAVYFRRAQQMGQDGKMHILDTPAIEADGKPRPQRKMTVHTIFQYSMHDAYEVEGPRKGMRIMEEIWENGQRISRPAKMFDLDDYGRPIRRYMRGWSPEERRDQILATFYMLAPQEMQAQPVAAAPADDAAPAQPTLQNAVDNLFQGGQQQGGAAPGSAPQGGAQETVNPL